jgi:hypothetical protein
MGAWFVAIGTNTACTVKAIDENLKLLKRHLPYHESDHVLNIAYNILSNGDCLEDLERLRNDEVYLNALGVQRIPDPTTAGDFCRRFTGNDVEILMDTINHVRLDVWKQQLQEFFNEAVIDADGTITGTTGECKEGMDMSYKGIWGYHPLLVSLANTSEPLYLVNRSGNCTSSHNAARYINKAIGLCSRGGFKKILIRGDTDFSQTKHLDEWDDQNVRFVFGINAMRNLEKLANGLPECFWRPLRRPAKYDVRTEPRQRPENVKERIVVEREYKNIRCNPKMLLSLSIVLPNAKKLIVLLSCEKISRWKKANRFCSTIYAISFISPTILKLRQPKLFNWPTNAAIRRI